MGFTLIENTITPAVNRLLSNMSSQSIYEAISPVLSADIQKNIQTQGNRIGVTWPPLADITLAGRRRYTPGSNVMMLIDTAQLIGSVNTISKSITKNSAKMYIVASRKNIKTGRDIAKDLHEGVGPKKPGRTGQNLGDPAVLAKLKKQAESLKGKAPSNIPARPYMLLSEFGKKNTLKAIIRLWRL